MNMHGDKSLKIKVIAMLFVIIVFSFFEVPVKPVSFN